MTVAKADILTKRGSAADRAAALLQQMTLAEKIGQMSQVNVGDSYVHDYLADAIRAGRSVPY